MSNSPAGEPVTTGPALRHYDAVIVGAGFAGLYMLYRLRGLGLSVCVFEAGSGVGGTWYWNRYPGARCDVESMQYSYQFCEELQQAWEWSERYAAQPEILRYANHVADRFDLRADIQFDRTVECATFDDHFGRWVLKTSDGASTTASFCIMATGCLSVPNEPQLEGMDNFRGNSYHTGRWPHATVDFTGQRVGVIGTGSSAVQSIPQIAKQAAQLYVFQRTAHFAVPAHNKPLDGATRGAVKAQYGALRRRAKNTFSGLDFVMSEESAFDVSAETRERRYEEHWRRGGLLFTSTFRDLLASPAANETAADFVRAKIRKIVHAPVVAEQLVPRTIIGCKRLIIDIGYFETYNRPNVKLVDISDRPIERATGTGLRANGKDFELDAIVFATGFDAMTGALRRIDIRGRRGAKLNDKWAAGPRAYLGIAMAGFPNLFTITGPGSPSVLTNMLPSIEQHVEWVADCIAYMRGHGLDVIDPELDAEDAWVEHANEVAGLSLRSKCDSWYVGANVPGKPRVFAPYIGGLPAYTAKIEEVAAGGYQGFSLRKI
ncbi:MAG: flavin-containing monooxygenase [Gammaproteobacteria bacterium]